MGRWRNTIERIISKHVNKTDTCWNWTGYKKLGYGHAQYGGKLHQAHRLIYEALRGPIPEGLVIDHLCRNPSCVNPDHLEPVTQAENVRRSHGNGSKTHCKNGHPLSGDNVYFHSLGNSRHCRICKYAAHRVWVAKNKERVRNYLRAYKAARKATI